MTVPATMLIINSVPMQKTAYSLRLAVAATILHCNIWITVKWLLLLYGLLQKKDLRVPLAP